MVGLILLANGELPNLPQIKPLKNYPCSPSPLPLSLPLTVFQGPVVVLLFCKDSLCVYYMLTRPD